MKCDKCLSARGSYHRKDSVTATPIPSSSYRTRIVTAALGVVQVMPMFRETNWTKGLRVDSTLADSRAVR